ncbi:MAG TPA: hypoxanthine phosphoribosyltransferase [Clostridiales bacterium]|nr:hypoxanthine phosphoribosyltransferase [Clostridiales bacterium]
MEKILKKILIDKETLQKRISELAAELDREYEGKTPVIVCVLRGSVYFFSDLTREMKTNVEMDFMAVSSYGNGFESTGDIRIKKDLDTDIEGRDVIIVEDIVDSGNTMHKLREELLKRKPASLKVVTLLNKASRRVVDVKVDYVAFEIPDEFIVGYGLDFKNVYRNISEVGVLKEEYYR